MKFKEFVVVVLSVCSFVVGAAYLARNTFRVDAASPNGSSTPSGRYRLLTNEVIMSPVPGVGPLLFVQVFRDQSLAQCWMVVTNAGLQSVDCPR